MPTPKQPINPGPQVTAISLTPQVLKFHYAFFQAVEKTDQGADGRQYLERLPRILHVSVFVNESIHQQFPSEGQKGQLPIHHRNFLALKS